MSTATETHTPAEIAKIARQALRADFPGVKFSVTLSRGTGYGYINVKWDQENGPTSREVNVTTLWPIQRRERFMESFLTHRA